MGAEEHHASLYPSMVLMSCLPAADWGPAGQPSARQLVDRTPIGDYPALAIVPYVDPKSMQIVPYTGGNHRFYPDSTQEQLSAASQPVVHEQGEGEISELGLMSVDDMDDDPV